jgi:hypothetical protein
VRYEKLYVGFVGLILPGILDHLEIFNFEMSSLPTLTGVRPESEGYSAFSFHLG